MSNLDVTKLADSTFKPTLYDVHKSYEEEVVGEYRTRLALFTNWILGRQNIIMTGS